MLQVRLSVAEGGEEGMNQDHYLRITSDPWFKPLLILRPFLSEMVAPSCTCKQIDVPRFIYCTIGIKLTMSPLTIK